MKGKTVITILPFLLVVAPACAEKRSMPLAPDADLAVANARPQSTSVRSELGTAAAIAGDGGGAYQHGVNGVVSIIQSIGDWELDLTGRKSTRKVRIDFLNPVAGNPGSAPFASAVVPARMIAKASMLNSGGFTGMIGVGASLLSPLSVSFSYGGANYAIRMNSTNHPGTDWVRVSCTAVADPTAPSTSACVQWSVAPSAMYDSVAKNVGYLERVGSPSTFIGHFYFTLDFTITK